MNYSQDDFKFIHLASLKEHFCDDHSLISEAAQIYLDQLDDKLSKIQTALEKQDFEQGRFEAHSLKGSSSNFQMNSIVEQFADLENFFNDQKLEKAQHCFQALMQNMDDLKKEIQALSSGGNGYD